MQNKVLPSTLTYLNNKKKKDFKKKKSKNNTFAWCAFTNVTNFDLLRGLACFPVEIGDNAWQELVLHSKTIILVGPRSSLCKKEAIFSRHGYFSSLRQYFTKMERNGSRFTKKTC